jgi:hypothetical protein
MRPDSDADRKTTPTWGKAMLQGAILKVTVFAVIVGVLAFLGYCTAQR